jgi:hypothetical protein
MHPSQPHGWTLYSPAAPSDVETPVWGESLDLRAEEVTSDGFHQGGWLLPEAAVDGWQFGVSQSRIGSGRLHAFVRLPSGEEASLIWDRTSSRIKKVEVPEEPGYCGALLLNFTTEPTSRPTLVAALIEALPQIQNALASKSGATDA